MVEGDADECWEGLYRRAVFAELAANEGCLDTENGLDFSLCGLAGKQNAEALPALMQQCILLCAKENPTAETGELLDDVLTKLSALRSKIKKNGGPKSPEPAFEGWIDRLGQLLLPPKLHQDYEAIGSFYQELLRPPPAAPSLPTPLPSAATTHPSRVPVIKENMTVENSNRPEPVPTAPRGDFVTAGQMLGRPTPQPKATLGGPPRKPVGLSKRVKTEPPKPIPANGMPDNDGCPKEDVDPRLKGIDPKLLETIQNEIIHRVDTVTWDQIAGLEHAKNTIKEIVIWPMLRPDIFTGLRGPPKGLLLFGPPGTGKTMIGKCIASQAQATFFSISASSLTSKWVGEGEKLVRALFACARALQPSVVFIDEIDSLLTQRTDGEFEASRRIKTEFLVQFDGAATSSADRILVIGATNRPQELDEAARRRLVKRLYIPLPDETARATIVRALLASQQHLLTDNDVAEICRRTTGYSGADVDNLCREAALGPIRGIENILAISADQVRPISMDDFIDAMRQVRASVSTTDLDMYIDWNNKFGSLAS